MDTGTEKVVAECTVSTPVHIELVRITVGHAYPRNGNFGNPTPRYRWVVRKNGDVIDAGAKKSDVIDTYNLYAKKEG